MVGQKVVGHSLGPHVLRAGAVIHDDAVVDVDGLRLVEVRQVVDHLPDVVVEEPHNGEGEGEHEGKVHVAHLDSGVGDGVEMNSAGQV